MKEEVKKQICDILVRFASPNGSNLHEEVRKNMSSFIEEAVKETSSWYEPSAVDKQALNSLLGRVRSSS